MLHRKQEKILEYHNTLVERVRDVNEVVADDDEKSTDHDPPGSELVGVTSRFSSSIHDLEIRFVRDPT
jgi:hypothetical protein